jgi:serine/threonine-protein kinase
MGTVYKAEQAAPRRIVAIKVLSGATLTSQSVAAFRREADTIARLEHPHILPLYDFGERDGTPYFVLRYLSGGSVADRLRQGPLDLPTATRWLTCVADALDFAHQKGLVHRDIKPSNVLLDESGNAYLTDFGISGALTAQTGSGTPLGSAAYMSPEQGRGEAVDARADIYALAVMAFEMLTGRKPYQAETALGLIVRHVNDPIPSARALNPAVPPAIDELIQWGMAKDPAARPQSAAGFMRLWQTALAKPDAPLRPSSAETTVVAARPRRQFNWLLWIGVVIGIGLCLLGLTAFGGGALAILLSPSATPLPTATKLPTLEPAATIAPTPAGQLLADDFTDSGSGFAVGSDPDGGVTVADGLLQFTVLTDGIEWFSPSKRVNTADVKIDVDVQQTSGPAKSEMTAICRWQDFGNYTAFAISNDGMFAVWQKRAGTVTRLHDWTPAPSLADGTGATHHLAVTCAGSHLRFEADDELLAEATDPQPAAGDVALMAGLREVGQLMVAFDNLKVTRP